VEGVGDVEKGVRQAERRPGGAALESRPGCGRSGVAGHRERGETRLGQPTR
jgi:hypothetical protein